MRTDDRLIHFVDRLQGVQSQNLELESGDFIIRRRDGLIAYQLAVTVDDELQRITEVVRGIDLLGSTPRQIYLQQLLGFTTPEYLHIPIAINADGQKLSKLTGAPDVMASMGHDALYQCLVSLGQRPPASVRDASLDDIWSWALENWQLPPLVNKRDIRTDDGAMAGRQNGLS